MPNRIIKESICTSDTLDQLSPEEEVFWYRLLVQCDDYGCMDARLPILLARCYPLRLGTVKPADIARWLKALVRAGLVRLYTADGKPYLYLPTWSNHQQLRAKRRRYPQPPEDDGAGEDVISDASTCEQMPADDSGCCSESNPNTNTNTNTNTKGNESGADAPARRKRRQPVPPAVAVMRDEMQRYPARATYQEIADAVGEDQAALDRWRGLCRQWVRRGYNAGNVEGLLGAWRAGGLAPRTAGNGAHPDETVEEAAVRLWSEP